MAMLLLHFLINVRGGAWPAFGDILTNYYSFGGNVLMLAVHGIAVLFVLGPSRAGYLVYIVHAFICS